MEQRNACSVRCTMMTNQKSCEEKTDASRGSSPRSFSGRIWKTNSERSYGFKPKTHILSRTLKSASCFSGFNELHLSIILYLIFIPLHTSLVRVFKRMILCHYLKVVIIFIKRRPKPF